MYATPQDILDRYGDTGLFLAGRTEEGLPDTSPLMTALEEASSEIDAALRGRYRLPVESVPPVLRRIALDLAVDAIPRNAPETADLFERRAKAARELLKAIAKGDVSLGIPELAGSASGGMAYYAPPSDFQTELEKM